MALFEKDLPLNRVENDWPDMSAKNTQEIKHHSRDLPAFPGINYKMKGNKIAGKIPQQPIDELPAGVYSYNSKFAKELKIIRMNIFSDTRWEEFVLSHPDGLVYHHPAYLKALEAEYGENGIYLAYVDDADQVKGIFPLFHTGGFPFRKKDLTVGERLSSLPRTPLAGPLAVDNDVLRLLLEFAIKEVEEQGSPSLQIKTTYSDLHLLQPSLIPVPWRMSYSLELPQNPEAIRFGNSRNHGRLKRSVRCAKDFGVQVRESDEIEDLRCWYKLYLETMRIHKIPPRSLRFFTLLWENLKPAGFLQLYLAENGDGLQKQLLAGSIMLGMGNTLFYAFNGSLRSKMHLHQNDAIQWRAIHDACQRGFTRYDFGEVTTKNVGLVEFKRKWNSEPVQLFRYYYLADKIKISSGYDTENGYRLLDKIWAHLPLRSTAFIGDMLYRFL